MTHLNRAVEDSAIVARMLTAAARETEVQRYLRQLEQQAVSPTLHSNDARHAIAESLTRAVQS